MKKLISLIALMGAMLFLQGCFLFEEKHDFEFEETMELISLNQTFASPLNKVENVKCVDFSVTQQYEKVSENWYKVSVNKKLELNGVDISKDYLKLLDLTRKTVVEEFFVDLVKDKQNLFKPDLVYINPEELSIYSDSGKTKTIEDDLKDASFGKMDWLQIFSKILDCYEFDKIPKTACQGMSVDDLQNYIVEKRIKNMACMKRLENDPEIQAKLNQWNLYKEYENEKEQIEFREKFLEPFKDNCFKDAACENDEICHMFKCNDLLCAAGFEPKDHECVYSPFEKDANNAKYVYLFVPLGKWDSDEQFEEAVLSRSDFMTDVYPLRDCKRSVSIATVPLSWANNRCKINDVKILDSMCPSVSMIASCAKTYARSAGINKIERIIGLSSGQCEGSVDGYAYFHFDSVYAQTESGLVDHLELPAHELAHTYKVCDEYLYKFWNEQNKEIKCPNKFPEYCDKESECTGNQATIVYSNRFEAEGNECKEKEVYTIMGSTATRKLCGVNQDIYDAIEKQISCSSS